MSLNPVPNHHDGPKTFGFVLSVAQLFFDSIFEFADMCLGPCSTLGTNHDAMLITCTMAAHPICTRVETLNGRGSILTHKQVHSWRELSGVCRFPVEALLADCQW